MSDLIDKIHKQVQDFHGQEFLAPYLGDNKIQVRIKGLVLTLRIREPRFYKVMDRLLVWVTNDGHTADPVGPASPRELREYINLFPSVRLLVTRIEGNRMWGIQSRTGTGKVQFTGEVPIINLQPLLFVDLFDEVSCCFDGTTFFCGEAIIDDPGSMMVAAKLREEIQDRRFTYNNETSLAARYMRPEHEIAFRIAWNRLIEDAKGMVETILGNAVSHAGGQLKGYKQDEDTYKVTIKVDDQEFRNVVVSQDMEVISAGICLSGQDRIFDLQSLVSVFREGQSKYDDDDDDY